MDYAGNNHMVIDRDAQLAAGIFDPLFHVGSSEGWCWIARRVIAQEDDGGGRKLERPLNHFAGLNWCVVNGAFLLQFIANEWVLLVEKHDA